MRDVLIVTRNFPPASHVSVERAMKLAKYLPEFGWRPTVLTGARATAGLPEDPGLAAQVAGIEVIRARAPEFSLLYGWRASGGAAKAGEHRVARHGAPRRGKLHPKAWLMPDSHVLWYPFAVRAALRRARAGRWDVIVATSFPPTAILIAHTIAARLTPSPVSWCAASTAQASARGRRLCLTSSSSPATSRRQATFPSNGP